MEAWIVHLRATYSQLKIHIWFVLTFVVIGRISEFFIILFSNVDGITRLSEANMLVVLLPMIAIILPLRYYKRIIHLGASRQQYFRGLHAVFAFWSAAIALVNSLWIALQVHVFHNYNNVVDLVDAFHWNDFGFAGSFLYQFVFYLMVMALLSMLVSGYASPVGWVLSALIIAAIPIGTASPSLRVHVVAFFKNLLFNEVLLQGVWFNLLLYLVFVAGGWLFTRVRVH